MQIGQTFTPYYENIEFNLSNGQSDYDLDANQAGFLSVFGPNNATRYYPTWLEVRSNEEISIKLNLDTNHSITISSTDTPYKIEGVEIRNVFLSNASGSTASVKLNFRQHA